MVVALVWWCHWCGGVTGVVVSLVWWCHCGGVTGVVVSLVWWCHCCGGVTGVVVSLLSLQLCKSSTLASTLWSGAKSSVAMMYMYMLANHFPSSKFQLPNI